MGTFFVYVLKSSVCLAMFYLFFRILLSKETFHRFNRIALLGILFLSLLLPWVEVTTGRQMEVQQTMLTLEHLLQKTETTSSIVADEADITSEAVSLSWVEILLFVYGGRHCLFYLSPFIFVGLSFQVDTFRQAGKVGKRDNTCGPSAGDSSVQLDEVYRYQPEGFGGERTRNPDS